MAEQFDTNNTENITNIENTEDTKLTEQEVPIEESPTEGIPAEEAPKKKRGWFKELFDCFETFCHALVLMMLLFVFVFRFVTVSGTSMVNTLHHEDKLIISDMFYTPATGDIVVLNTDGMGAFSDKYIIKRIIATGGQRVEIDFVNWAVTVDGALLEENYVFRGGDVVMESAYWITSAAEVERVYEDKVLVKASFTVPQDMLFVMGDNRNGSSDSRAAGYFEEERILGRVLIRIGPWDVFGRVE